MEPFRYHVYLCEQQKPEGLPCCSARGARAVVDALRKELAARGLFNEVQVTGCGSLGLCERGPNMVVYPEGVWYSGLTPEDVPEIVESHFMNGRPVARLVNTDAAALKTEIQGNRDRFLAAQRAKDAAGVLPDDLQQTIRGFMDSRVVLTALELNVFTALGSGATAAEAAARIGADARATEMLLNALAAMGLAGKQNGVFRNTPLMTRYFTDGSPDDARMATLHTANLWRRWSTLTDAVRAGTSVYTRDDGARLDGVLHRGHAPQCRGPRRARGGQRSTPRACGACSTWAAARAPTRSPSPAPTRISPPRSWTAPRCSPSRGATSRRPALPAASSPRPGDLRADNFGSGYDLVLLSAICHMLSADENRDLLRALRTRRSRPAGRVAIQDFILNADKTAPRYAALFSLNMLVATAGGASYSEDEYAAWLREAGFTGIRHIPLPGPADLITGVRG